MDTFAPAAAGWSLQRPVDYDFEDVVAQGEGEIGNRISIAVADKVLRAFSLTYRGLGRDAYDYLSRFFDRHKTAVKFSFQAPELLPNPQVAPTVEAVSGGTQGARSITACFAFKVGSNRTECSPTATIAVGANELVKVTLPVYPAGASEATIYAAQDNPGNELAQVDLSQHDREWTQPDAALLIGTDPPETVNDVTELVTCRFARRPRITRGAGLFYLADVQLREVYA